MGDLTKNDRLQHKGNLDFIGLARVIYTLLEILWGKGWGTFIMENPMRLDSKDVEMPTITYQLTKIEPGEIGNNTRERKPRRRGAHEIVTEDGEKRTMIDMGQRMDGELVFTVFANGNKETLEHSQAFMDVIQRYKGVLMAHGIQNIWFKSEEEENVSTRDDIIARKITYHVTFERIFTNVPDNIQPMAIEVDTYMDKMIKEGNLPF